MSEELEKHLRVFEDHSEYHAKNGHVELFPEGEVSVQAKRRTKAIKQTFEGGFLENLIQTVISGGKAADMSSISNATVSSLNALIDLTTSEKGRALIGLTVMQLSIKSIEPSQSIRLHKGSSTKTQFSWKEGISMRVLDKNYVTPVLRKYNLLKLNADGFMMTRSLAENYPYSSLYKARVRGAREEWLNVTEELELGQTSPIESLKYFISLLSNRAIEFDNLAKKALTLFSENKDLFTSRDATLKILCQHTKISDYAARLLEVSMHSLYQASIKSGALGEVELKPLSQMRSANKKHGNIGDIELLENSEIVESWDAKYGKAYLREELEEAAEKCPNHLHVSLVGFVTNEVIERSDEMDNRISDLNALHGINFTVISLSEWVKQTYEKCLSTKLISEKQLSTEWGKAYIESLAQKRREIAPIDEPCQQWIESYISLLE